MLFVKRMAEASSSRVNATSRSNRKRVCRVSPFVFAGDVRVKADVSFHDRTTSTATCNAKRASRYIPRTKGTVSGLVPVRSLVFFVGMISEKFHAAFRSAAGAHCRTEDSYPDIEE